MRRLINWFNILIKKRKELKRWQRIVTVLAAVITFATTYALILPAITVEKDTTSEVAGMYLEESTDGDGMQEENALEPTGVTIAADMDNAVSFACSDGDMTATAVFSTDEEIPEGTELVVNLVDPQSEEYADLHSRSESLLDKEFIYDVTTCSFYDFALVCDNVDVTPKTGLVDIQIIFRNNTVEHIDDMLFAGRFARPAEEVDGLVTVAADTVSPVEGMSAVVNETIDTENNSNAEDELVSSNSDESSVIELADGIITSLTLKGNDLTRNDSVVGILAGNVDEETKAAAAETDAEIPDNDNAPEETEADSPAEDDEEITTALPVKTLKASGSDYTVTLSYDETSGIPDGAHLDVSEIAQDSKEYQTYLKEAKKAMGLKEEETVPSFAARFFDIKIMVGDHEFTPETGVSVEITYSEPLAEHPDTEVNAVHFADETAEAEVIEANTSEVQEDGQATIEFTAESFSVYGVIYTVDFHYEINEKMYDFSIPGGGFVSLEHVVEVLGIASADENSKNGAENAENEAENGKDFVGEVPGVDASGEKGTAYEEAINLNGVEVSEATKKFVADVESVEFSNPELVWVGKVYETTTVGELKDANGLEIEYSADLTEEQIAEINAQTVEAGDWALISVHPFTSEETLTITMADGKMFEIRVTDAIVSSDNLDDDKQYILYAVTPLGAYYALKNDGSCVRVAGNNLDALDDKFLWSVEQPDWDTDWNKNIKMWRSVVGNYAINLWWENDNTAVANDPSHTYLESAGYGGYYFKTNNNGNGNRTFALWFKLDMSDWTWSFVVGDANEGNQSRIYIYEQETHHQLNVNVDDDNSDAGWVYINNSWQHEGKIDIGADGYNAERIIAAPGSGSGYWFDHWELDGNTVPESDSIRTYQQNGDIYCVIEEGGLYIGNEEGHELTAVFVAETNFNVEAGEGGTVNVTTSPRTRDGYNKSVITATANDGYWFDHWEVDGQTVEGNVQAEEDGSKCTVPKGGIHVGEGETLKAVFIPEVKYDVVVTREEGGTAQGCTVKVGNGTPDTNVPNNKMNRAGFNTEDIVATAGPGYVFKGWLLDDEPILGDAVESAADGSTSKIKAGKLRIGTEEGHTIKAVFAQEYTFVVTTSPSGAGKVQDDSKTAAGTIAGSMTKDNKNKYDIKALPSSGYRLMYWTLNGQPLMDKNDETAYAYINGNTPTIPAGELDIISSDELCAVFVKDAYKITSTSAGNGRVSPSPVYTESNNESSKKAGQEITATPNNNYKFAYWKVDPIDAVENWGSGKAVNSSTIQPTVNTDTALKAFFVPNNTRIYTVRVDNPEHGRVYSDVDVLGQSATVNNEVNPNFNISNYGETSFVLRTNNSNKNEGGVEVRTTLNGYEFVGWKLYHSNGSLYQDYTNNNNLKNYKINKNTLSIPYDNMILEACFQKRETPEAFQDESVADLNDWASEKAGTEFDLDKTAEVFDYDNRIYRINMSAASKKEAIDSSVVLNFITDVSRSMYFPANLTTVKNNYGQDDSYNYNLANWLNDKSKNNVYYIIGSQNKDATVYTVYYNWSTNRWEYVDASYYPANADDGLTRTGNAVSGYNVPNGDNCKIYVAPTRTSTAPWSRLDYLMMSVEAATKVIYEICPNAQIDLTTFNREAQYKGTLPNNDPQIEALLRTIDVAGGTRQDLGLKEAEKHFTDGSAKRQVAVLITDGAPNTKGSPDGSNYDVWSAAHTIAGRMKNMQGAGENLEIYTMGLSIANVGNNASELAQCATQDGNHSFAVNNGTETANAIKKIVENLLTEVSLFGSITDTVDPAFYPVDINGNPIAPGIYAANGATLSNPPTDNSPYYVWENNGGTWKITWHNQTIGWTGNKTIDGPWSGTIYVKAKEDFLGGNKIETNAGNSNGLTATGYVKTDTSVTPLTSDVTKTLDYTPYVNVDELHMDHNDTVWTVYLGTEVNPATQIKELFNEIPVKQVVKPGGTTDTIYVSGADQMSYEHGTAVDTADDPAPEKGASQTLPLSYYVNLTSPEISGKVNEALQSLARGSADSVTIDNIAYNEYGHAAGTFKVNIERNLLDPQAKTDGAPNNHETKRVGNAVETYTLKVEYTPSESGASNTYPHTVNPGQITSGNRTTDKVESVNTHVINVITKGFEVIKTDRSTGNEITDKQATFTLYRALKTRETQDEVITVDGAQIPVKRVTALTTGGAQDANKVSSLPWYASGDHQHDGQYFLKEDTAPEGYLPLSEPSVITVTTTDAYTDLSGESVVDVAGIPYNNTQTAELAFEVDGESIIAEERNGLLEMKVPNPPKGALAVRKEVNTLNDEPINDLNGVYSFYISGPVSSNVQYTYYVDLSVEGGEMTHYVLETYPGYGAERVVANRLSREEGDVDDPTVGCLITDIQTGIYAMKELGWQLTTAGIEDDIYLRDIRIEPASGGNTNDVVARTTSVYVQSDDTAENPLKVTFINEYGDDIDRFGVKKIWKDKDGNTLTGPWDSMISSIEFSVSQKNGDESRLLTFGDSTSLTLWRSGRRAVVSPEEPGSASYDVEWAMGGDAWQTLITGLEKTAPDGSEYSYRIEELCVRNVFGDVVTGYETTYDLSENGGSLITESGVNVGVQAISNGATVYVNNKQREEARLNLRKVVQTEYAGGDMIPTNGTYPFTITGPEGAETPTTWYVNIIADSTDNGENVSPRYTTTYTYQIGTTPAERDAMTAVTVEEGGVPIDVAPGKYTIIEQAWIPGDALDGGIMYLKDIDLSHGGNNETDISQNKAVVYVGGGEVGSLEVVFTNCLKPYPGIKLVKIDETTRPADKMTKYLSGAEFQLLKWGTTKYEVYPDEAGSKAITDDEGVAAFNGLEPGEYKIVETVTPPGYVKLVTNDIYIKVEYNASTGLHTVTRYREAYTGNDSEARTVISESENVTGVTFTQAVDEADTTFTVGNEPGAALPSTGGPGTKLIYFLGIILTSLAGTAFMMRKRCKTW